MRFHVLPAAFILAAGLTWVSPARALDFYFTFDGLVNGGAGSTVSGEIFGLEDNATSMPTSIVVNSAPFGVLPVTFAPPFGGGFTVDSGMLTDGSVNTVASPADGFYQLILNHDNNTFYYETGLDHNNFASDGLPGVVYTPAAVPEPSGFGVAVFTAMLLVIVGRRLPNWRSTARGRVLPL